jgi:hypothetical protein
LLPFVPNQQTLASPPPTADLLLQGLRQFNFFSTETSPDTTTNSNLSFMMRLMAKSILSNDAKLNVAAQAHLQPLQWVYPIRKFLLTMQKLIANSYKRLGSSADLNLAVQLLAFFTDLSNIDKYAYFDSFDVSRTALINRRRVAGLHPVRNPTLDAS